MQSTIERINEIVRTSNATDFVVQSYARDSLLLTGSFDHSYYHELELHFRGVAYIELPTYGMESPVLSIASDATRKLYSHLELEPEEILFEIHHAPDFHGGQRYYVAAREIELVEGMVYYYARENLKPGERIADWLRENG